MNRSNVALLLGAVCLLALYGASAEPLRHLKAKGRLSPDQQQPVFASVGETLDLEKRRRAEPGYDAVRGGGDITVTGDGTTVETNNRGFYDPHNHYTGILDYRSIGLMLSYAKYDTATFEDHGSEKRAEGKPSILAAKLTQLYTDIAPAVKVANDKLGNQYDVFDPSDSMLYVHQYLSTGFLAGVSFKGDKFEASQTIPSRTGVKPMAVTFDGGDKTKLETALGKLKEFKDVLYQEMYVWGKRFYEQMKDKKDQGSWVYGDAPRTTFGSWSHMGLLKCMAEGGKKDDKKKDDKPVPLTYSDIATIKNVLDQSLTASASVDFDTSYALRGLYEDAAKNTKGDADKALTQYAKLVVQQLIDSNIRYVELSQPIGKVPFDKTLLGTLSEGVQAVLGGSKGYPGTKLWAVFDDSKVKDKIRIRWLPMYFQKRLAYIGDNKFLMQWVKKAKTGEGQQFEAIPTDCGKFSTAAWVNPDQLAAVKFLLQFDHVVGVDYASPEVGIFDFNTATEGSKNFEADATALATVCGEKGKRCVMHIHSGEGYPMYNFHAYFKTKIAQALIDKPVDGQERFKILIADPDLGFKDFKAFCDNAQLSYQDASKAPIVKVVMIKNAQGKPSQPLHYEGGRQNIKGIIGGLEKLKAVKDEKLQKAWFGTENESPIVLFRLGHATHLTYDMAKEMRKYDLMVDNNYQSNLATGALGWNSYHARASKGFREDNVGDLLTLGGDLLKNFAVGADERDPVFDAKLALYFNGIGLYAAFLAGVQVMPGSDGAGSENSDIHEGYMIAHTLLSNFVSKCDKADAKPYNSVQLTDICAKWWADDKSPIKHDITAQGVLNHLLNYQRFYSRYMFGDDCVKAKEKGSKHKCKLLKPWDTDPTKARVLRFA